MSSSVNQPIVDSEFYFIISEEKKGVNIFYVQLLHFLMSYDE